MLGCIPRSPSPEVPNPEDEAIAPESAIQEVRDLRVSPTSDLQKWNAGIANPALFTQARLAVLERSLQVKNELTSTPKNLKRERDEKHDKGSFQRRRLAAKVEHVDLTGD